MSDRRSKLPVPTDEQRRVGLKALRQLGYSKLPPAELIDDDTVLDQPTEAPEWRL